ncbi:hypothetical protein LV457_12515 [Mycobacterium sp. MYCO198283]|uniref:hypothetical protein n=1 Tax=Mycobacterium sp. MYCO198283 TaxID=2883505 RepID=UPI001E3D16B3|nr:hypothetical protein [Mycobacterium sp. MYCO198283]MCG5433100.1 hypothetical protein [Mycobacterium sp. MYCO198283]
MREAFPAIDVVHVQTATAPLYHLVTAALSESLGLGQAGTEVTGGTFAAVLAAVVVWFAGTVARGWCRALAVLPLLLSPYFWESALWMLNDAAALLFGFGALAVVLRRPDGRTAQLVVGMLLAAAVATRQTYVWAVVPAMAAVLLANRHRPQAQLAAIGCRVAVPPLLVLTALVVLWHGFVPPFFHEINAATRSWVSLSYCFAVAAMFLTPVLLCVEQRRSVPRVVAVAAVGLAVLPALIFSSTATVSPDDTRRGGLIWGLVAHGPAVGGRSLVLVALAGTGAYVTCRLAAQLSPPCAVVATTGLCALAVVLSAGGQLYQKYFELPIAALAVFAVCDALSAGTVTRRWPLCLLVAVQAMLTIGIVIRPIVSALSG